MTDHRSPRAVAALPGPPVPVVGQGVELDLFGTAIPGTVIRATDVSAAVRLATMASVRSLRIGVRLRAVFAGEGVAVEITCRVTTAPDYVLLEYQGPPRWIQRRRSERIPLAVDLRAVWLDGAGSPVDQAGITEDISSGGVRWRLAGGTAQPPPVGGLVLLDFAPPALGAAGVLRAGAGERLEVAGRVLGVQTAVRVEFLSPEDRLVDVLLRGGGCR